MMSLRSARTVTSSTARRPSIQSTTRGTVPSVGSRQSPPARVAVIRAGVIAGVKSKSRGFVRRRIVTPAASRSLGRNGESRRPSTLLSKRLGSGRTLTNLPTTCVKRPVRLPKLSWPPSALFASWEKSKGTTVDLVKKAVDAVACEVAKRIIFPH
jgi:hypothetical protein